MTETHPSEPGTGHVVVLRKRMREGGHNARTLDAVAGRIAALMGYAYAGARLPKPSNGGPVYFVPDDTLLAAEAASLGIRHPGQLFGGVVPHRFVATKSISHGALDRGSRVPDGWSHELANALTGAVLPGYSAFTAGDVRSACLRLLENGDVRLKPALGIGGARQTIASCGADVERVVREIAPAELATYGVVIEPNLRNVVTYSVGTATLAGLRIGYVGIQRVTTNRLGDEVYGGSTLRVVRGGFDAVLAIVSGDDERLALQQAMQYDAATRRAFPGFFASRRNYDVAQGNDACGRRLSGVLEQSWRIGGASPAEIDAVEALLANPSLSSVTAATHEFHGDHTPPSHARVVFSGHDERVGLISKYSGVEDHGHPA